MQPAAYPVDHDQLSRLWHTFVHTGQLDSHDAAGLDPAVLQSWRRCALRLSPQARPRPNTLTEQALTSVLKAQGDLIAIATPFIEDIHQFIEGSGCAILLANGTACVLSLCGDAPAVAAVNGLGLGQGAYWSEGRLGSNALGLALLIAMPAQVVGAEHYCQVYHHLVSTAAPIHDVNGRIAGLIAVAGPAEGATSHTLGLLMASARAIGSQLQTEWYVQEANQRLTEVNTILEAISEGVIAWNGAGKIMHVNAPAGQMLRVSPAAVRGRSLAELMELPAGVREAVAENREVSDLEVTFQVGQHSFHCLVNLRPIYQGVRQADGHIALLRPIEHIRQLVHQQVGVQASIRLEDMAGESPGLRRVVRQARIAARGTAPVLLRGEGGVGKNPLARAIHNESPRAARPFIAINCQAIPHELMAAEFLGYEKDAASNGRPSKFELAHGGTLLLDPIEHLSLEMQAALLHLLETGHVMRLGGTRPIAVDARIIATTSANLEALVEEGSFLAHLYYRFGVFNFLVAPLRDRVEDIPLLTERFLTRITLREGRPFWIDDEALEALKRYPWPGNVRELESVLERALSHSSDGSIQVADLPETVRYGRFLAGRHPRALPLLSVSDAEREAILRAGWACHGRVSEMAHQLGIGRTTLWRKMKQLDISPAYFKA